MGMVTWAVGPTPCGTTEGLVFGSRTVRGWSAYDRKGATVPIYQTAHYQVEKSRRRGREGGDRRVRELRQSERAGTELNAAWQQVEDPTRFTHVFIFTDEDAQATHSESAAVSRFEEKRYSPHLVGGPVVFTDFTSIADNIE